MVGLMILMLVFGGPDAGPAVGGPQDGAGTTGEAPTAQEKGKEAGTQAKQEKQEKQEEQAKEEQGAAGGAKASPTEPEGSAGDAAKKSADQDAGKAEPLRTDAVIQELARMDRNDDGAVSYLEARDLGSVDLATFRRIDTDESGGLDLLELETYMVQTYQSGGLPVERSLELRVKAHVEELAKQREEEAARQRPTYLLEKSLEALMDNSQIGSNRPITTTRMYHRLLPDRPRPRSPYHPRYHGY